MQQPHQMPIYHYSLKWNVQESKFKWDILLLVILFYCHIHSCLLRVYYCTRQFHTEEIAGFHCIDHIICLYIMMVTLTPFNLDKVESQVLSLPAIQMLNVCKVQRLQQLHHESYLGPMQFEDDLMAFMSRVYLELKRSGDLSPWDGLTWADLRVNWT